MTLWSAFFPELLLHASSCPDPLLEKLTRSAAIEFFQRTRAWTEWLDPATSIAGSVEYDLDVPTGSDVTRVERATVDGAPIDILSYRTSAYDWTRKDLAEQGLVTRDMKTFRLGNTVAAGLMIQVQVALVPSRISTGLPDDLFSKYLDDIVHGARARLVSTPPFVNPDIYVMENAEFEHSIDVNSVDAWRGHTANTPRARVKLC